MKTNLKVLMLAMLVGASFSANAYWGQTWVESAKNNAGKGYNYLKTGSTWKNPYFLGTAAATVGITAGIAYLICKKIKCKKEKARFALAE